MNRLRSLSLIYAGIALTVFPLMFLSGFHLPELLSELVGQLGAALFIAGIIWLILDLFFRRFEDIVGESHALSAKGIKNLRELNPKNIDEILDQFPASSRMALQFNVQEANRVTLELVNALQQGRFQRAQILVTGLNKEISREGEQSFVTRMLTELLERSAIQNKESEAICVKFTAKSTFATVLLGEKNVLIIVAYGTNGENSILLNVDFSSELAEQYQKQFDALWETADKY